MVQNMQCQLSNLCLLPNFITNQLDFPFFDITFPSIYTIQPTPLCQQAYVRMKKPPEVGRVNMLSVFLLQLRSTVRCFHIDRFHWNHSIYFTKFNLTLCVEFVDKSHNKNRHFQHFCLLCWWNLGGSNTWPLASEALSHVSWFHYS
jgi:hypothetical protein